MALRAVSAAVVSASLAVAAMFVAPPADAVGLESCAQRVIRDWYDGGRIDKLYPLRCYRAAIRALPDDVLHYTDAPNVIERALEEARKGQVTATAEPAPSRKDPAPAPRKPKPDPLAAGAQPSGPSASSGAPPEKPETAPTLESREPGPPAPSAEGTRNASPRTAATASSPGLPYPLIVLAALAAVLLASGLAGLLARRRR